MTFSELESAGLSDLKNFIKRDIYYAHLPEKGTNKPKETLQEHIQLVEKYFLLLVKEHNIEPAIDNLIIDLTNKFQATEKVFKFTKTLFFNAIIYHDFGKINHEFQHINMQNFSQELIFVKHSESTHHSLIGAYIFFNHHLKFSEDYHFTDKEQIIADFLTTCFAYLILKHHSPYLSEININSNFDQDSIKNLDEFLNLFKSPLISEEKETFNDIIGNIELTFKQISELKLDFDYFPLFALLKLNWSLLTAADYYATSEYMNNLKVNDFGLLDEKLRETIFENFVKRKSYNRELLEKQQDYLQINPEQLDKSPESLNILRQRLGAEILAGIEKYKNEQIFYIEAPTGGGKTNLSMVAIRKLLEMHTEINKVFYVFPFTTLITQTLKSIKETLGLTEEHVAQVHSKAGFQSKGNDDDARYGNQLKNHIDNLFVNYPFTLLTHIKFFDILKSNDKKNNYLLHRLANSIVIIDEIQSYNPKHWDKVKYFISNYAKYFNIRFILMSATLPKLHNIAVSENELLKFNELIDNARENYLQNHNFSKRVTIKSDLLDIKDISLEQLVEIVYEKSEEYAKIRDDKYKNSIYTIIEFIFKKTATEFYEIIIERSLFTEYEIFVLSGTIIETRRKYIIEYLKDKENRKKKVLLITTQVVEAGVDIDMDLGFKNQSLVDSDEQLAGRVNRNVEKSGCELWLFKYDKPSTIYGKDLRFEVTNKIKNNEIRRILQEKDFNVLYQKVMEEINTNNKSVYKNNFEDYKNHIASLRFNEIHSAFKLIENDTVAIFIPENIPVVCYKKELNFSTSELNFLKRNSIYKHNEKYIHGKKVWKLYILLINNKELDFSLKDKEFKILNGIMSKFVFSTFVNKINDLKPYLDYHEDRHEYKVSQYYKLNSSYIGDENIYSLKSGLNEKKLGVSYEFF